jgi:hypothetical protein
VPVTKDSVAGAVGSPIILRPWQLETVRHLLARRPDGRYRHRQALIGIARKNGKSALGAGLALYSLVMGSDGSEVYSCAGDREQARIVFGTAKRMVELEPELAGLCKLYRDAIEVPETGSVYRVLSAEAYTKEGLNPTAVYFDEVHVQPNRELWDVMSLAMGARPGAHHGRVSPPPGCASTPPAPTRCVTACTSTASGSPPVRCGSVVLLRLVGSRVTRPRTTAAGDVGRGQPRVRRHRLCRGFRSRGAAYPGERVPDEALQPVGDVDGDVAAGWGVGVVHRRGPGHPGRHAGDHGF